MQRELSTVEAEKVKALFQDSARRGEIEIPGAKLTEILGTPWNQIHSLVPKLRNLWSAVKSGSWVQEYASDFQMEFGQDSDQNGLEVCGDCNSQLQT